MEELKRLGVKRILNLAIECDDDKGLELRERFEKYARIPMRDTVEEDNIAKGVREVCEILGGYFLPRQASHFADMLVFWMSQTMPRSIPHRPMCTVKLANHAP